MDRLFWLIAVGVWCSLVSYGPRDLSAADVGLANISAAVYGLVLGCVSMVDKQTMSRRAFFLALCAPFVAALARLFPKPKLKGTGGYKGAAFVEAGYFYCPYIPLYVVSKINEEDFKPKTQFRTRYGDCNV